MSVKSAVLKTGEKRTVDLTGYKEAMVFYGSGYDSLGCRLAVTAYAKQLLICAGKDIEKYYMNVGEIRRMFLEEETFSHLHIAFRLAGTVPELNALMDLLYDELCKYVSEDDLCYEPSDMGMWWDEMRERAIRRLTDDVSKEMGDFLNDLEIHGLFNRLWWTNTNISECTGYAWLGEQASVNYGFNNNKEVYSETFNEWCKRSFVKDKKAEKERLYKLFKVSDDQKLDDVLRMNMVD